MRRRATLGAVVVLLGLVGLLVAGVAAGDPGSEKERVDARIGELRGTLADADARAGVLTSELTSILERTRTAQAAVDAAESRLSGLRSRLDRQRAKLARLDDRIELQTARLDRLRAQYRLALATLERRVRELYMVDQPDLVSFLVGADSFGDLLDNLDLLQAIGRQDELIVDRVARSRDGVNRARRETRRTRAAAWRTARTIAGDVAEQETVTRQLASNRDALVAARSARESALTEIRSVQSEVHAEVEALEAQSAALGAEIRAAQERARQAALAQQASGAPASVSSGGALGWPVAGAVTSGFGMRWGRMHEGIDIAVAEGSAVVAAASGTVIYAGWLGGYGNLVVVDHGGGLATAYGHNASLAVGVGQAVVAGSVIASSGNTGSSTGPHVHFEVRVDGSPVDPFGYL